MSQVRAKVFLHDGQVMKLVFEYGLDELFEWVQRHHDDIDEFHAKLVKASEIRQGHPHQSEPVSRTSYLHTLAPAPMS